MIKYVSLKASLIHSNSLIRGHPMAQATPIAEWIRIAHLTTLPECIQTHARWTWTCRLIKQNRSIPIPNFQDSVSRARLWNHSISVVIPSVVTWLKLLDKSFTVIHNRQKRVCGFTKLSFRDIMDMACLSMTLGVKWDRKCFLIFNKWSTRHSYFHS